MTPTNLATEQRALFLKLESFLSSYMYFADPALATILTLWAIGTWTYQTFDAFPYLVITAPTKQAGKTRLMELLSMLSSNAHNFSALTPAVLFRLLGDANAKGTGATIFFDEAETLASEAASTMRAVLNVGYRRGQTIPRIVKGEVVGFNVYAPKAFVLIGDVYDTLRDRSIVATLARGRAPKSFQWAEVQHEAAALVNTLRPLARFTGDLVEPVAFVGGREAEIWTPLFSLASVWCPQRLNILTSASADMAAQKTAPKRRYSEQANSEDDTQDTSYAERLLTDMAGAIKEHKHMLSADMVTALRGIPDAPWRRYRGEGLSPVLLAHLVSRFGVAPKQFSTRVAGRPMSQRGYAREDVLNAAKLLTKGGA